MKDSMERASACAGEVCPRDSNFGRVAAAIDKAESAAWDRIGGPTDAEFAAIRRLEAALTTPTVLAGRRWLAGRLARAVANDWHAEARDRLAELAGAR